MPTKYSRQEFAQQIRKKFNAYDDWDDDSLVEGFVQKYPVYNDWVDSREEDLMKQAAAAPPKPTLGTETVQQRGMGTNGQPFVHTAQRAAAAPLPKPPAPPKIDATYVEQQGQQMPFRAQATAAFDLGLGDPLKRAITGATGGFIAPETTFDAPAGQEMAETLFGGALPYIAAGGAKLPSAAIGAAQGLGGNIATQLAAQAEKGTPGAINPLLALGEAAFGAAQGYLEPAFGAKPLTRLITGVGLNTGLNVGQVAAQQYAATGGVNLEDPNWRLPYTLGAGSGVGAGVAGAVFRGEPDVAAGVKPAAPGTNLPASFAVPQGTVLAGKALSSMRELPAGAASGAERRLELLFDDGTRLALPFPQGADPQQILAGLDPKTLVPPGQMSFGFGKPAGVEGPAVGSTLPELPPEPAPVPREKGQRRLPFRGRTEPGLDAAYVPPPQPLGQQALPFDEMWRTQPPPTGVLFPEEVDPTLGNVPAEKGQKRLPFRAPRAKKAPAAPPDLAAFDATETINLDAERKPNAGEARKLAKMGYTPDQVNAMTGDQAMQLIANNVHAKALAPAAAEPRLVSPKKGTVIPGFDAQLAGLAGAAMVPDDPDSEKDDLLRAGLLAGGAAAMGAAWYRRTGRLPQAAPERGYSYAYVPEAQLRATTERGKPARFEFNPDINAARTKVGTGTPRTMDAYVLVRMKDEEGLATKGGRVPTPQTQLEVFDPFKESWTVQERVAPAGKPRLASPPPVTETPRIVEGPDPAGFEPYRAFQEAVRRGDLPAARELKAAVSTDFASVPEGYWQDIADTYSAYQALEAKAAGPRLPGPDEFATRLSKVMDQVEPTTKASQATLAPVRQEPVTKFDAAAATQAPVEDAPPVPSSSGKKKAPKTVNPAALAAFDSVDDAPVPGTPIKPTLRKPDGTVVAGNAATAAAPLGDLTTQSFDQVPQAVWDDAARQVQSEFDSMNPVEQRKLIATIREAAEEHAKEKNLPPRLAIADMVGSGVAGAVAYAAAPEGQKELALAAALPIPGLYSRLSKGALSVFERAGAKKLNAASLLARVKSLASSEEIKWTGFADWLKERGQKPVTQEEVAKFLADNEVKVEEVRLSRDSNRLRLESAYSAFMQNAPSVQRINDPLFADFAFNAAGNEPTLRALHERLLKELVYGENIPNGLSSVPVGERTQLINDLANDAWEWRREAQQIGQEAVYGGEEYTRYRTSDEGYNEFILTLPSHKNLVDSHNWEPGVSGLVSDKPGGQVVDTEEFGQLVETNDEAPLLHIRTTDRTLPSGKKILVVEEIQSDLHQELKIRRDIHAGKPAPPGRMPGPNNIVSLDEARQRVDGNAPRGSVNDLADQLSGRGREWEPAFEFRGDVDAVDAPFSTDPGGMDWQNLAVKRIMLLAAEEGYDGVFFTGGREHAARSGAPPGIAARWEVVPNEDVVRLHIANEQGFVTTRFIPADQITQYGEASRPILDAMALNEAASGDLDMNLALSRTQKGNLHFYDNIVPDRVNKTLKQFGTNLRDASLPRGKTAESYMGGVFDEPTVDGKLVDITAPIRKMVLERGFDRGFVNTKLLAEGGSALGGGLVGSAAAASTTDDARDKRNRAIAGFFAGAIVGSGAARGIERFMQRELDVNVAKLGKAYAQVEPNSPPSPVLGFTWRGVRESIADAFVPFARLTREMRDAGIQSGPAVDAIRRLHDDFYVGAQKTAEQVKHILTPLENLEHFRAFFRIARLERNLELERKLVAQNAANPPAAGALPRTYLQGATIQETENALNALKAEVRANNWTDVDEALLRHQQMMKDIAAVEVAQGRLPASVLQTDTYFPDIILDFASDGMLQPTSVKRRFVKDVKRFSQFLSRGRTIDQTTGMTKKTWNDYVKTVGARFMQHHLESAKIALIERLAAQYDPNWGKNLPANQLVVPAGYTKYRYWQNDGTKPVYVLPQAMADELVTRLQIPSETEKFLNKVVNLEKGALIRFTMGGYFANNILGDTVNNFSTAEMGTAGKDWLALTFRDLPTGAAASAMKAFYFDRPNAPGIRQRMWDLAERANKANIGQGAAAADVSQQVLADPRIARKTDDPGRMAPDTLGKVKDLRIDLGAGLRSSFGALNRGYDMLRDFVEGTNRIARFNHEINNGLTDAQAGRVVLDAIYDYNDITPFEARFLRGLMVPFWTFTKKSLEAYAPIGLTDTGGVKINTPAWKRYMRTAPFAAAAVMWNHTYYPEVENDLPEWKRNQFHLIVPVGFNEQTGEQNLIYLGFPTPKNIAMSAMGMGGLGTRMADMIKGRTDISDFGEESIKQSKEFWLSLMNPIAQGLYGVFSNKDFSTGRQIAPENASWGEWAQAQGANTIGSLPPFSQLTAAARERTSEVGGEGFPTLRRMVTGSLYSPINREHDAARAAARTLAEGMQHGNEAERELKLRLAKGEENPQELLRSLFTTKGEIDPNKLPGVFKDRWLARAFSNARLTQTLKRALNTPIPTEGIPPSAVKPMGNGDVVEVPTIPQLAALGPDAALRIAIERRLQSPSDGRQWAAGAVTAMAELRKTDSRWDTTDAVLKLLQASPSWQEEQELDKSFEKYQKGAQPLKKSTHSFP